MLNSGPASSSGSSIPLIVFPSLAIMLTMFGFNMFGDGLRDAMDPQAEGVSADEKSWKSRT